MNHNLQSRLLEEIAEVSLRYTDDATLMVENKEELRSLLMTVKKDSEKLSKCLQSIVVQKAGHK